MFINYNPIPTPNSSKLFNLFKEEWTALINLKNRNDLVIKAAGKGGATGICPIELYQKESILGADFLHQRQR